MVPKKRVYEPRGAEALSSPRRLKRLELLGCGECWRLTRDTDLEGVEEVRW